MKTYTVSYLKRDGSGENHWITLGVAFEDPDTGRIRVKLDAVPAQSSVWDGTYTLFPREAK